jgi:phosphoribosyl 1,2-cyclic phosphate phosphodiesterase
MTSQTLPYKIETVILGCGPSSGVPVVACHCSVCQLLDPKNNRTRTAAWIHTESLSLLIDTGPDLRQQVLREQIKKVDAVLYTHAHADHLNGIDDLRAFCVAQKMAIPIYSDENTLQTIQHRFNYALSTKKGYWDKLTIEPHTVKAGETFLLKCLPITPILLNHGAQFCLGWRIGDMAWLTDISAIPDQSLIHLKNLKLLYLDCLRSSPYPAHLTIEQAFSYANQIDAQETVLIHMSHDIDYPSLAKLCPKGLTVGYDGMKLSIK